MSFDHLLNRPAEELAYSRSPGLLPSPPTPGPSAGSPLRSHKYSNSGASTASFASSTTTNPFGSHSRKSSSTTNPGSPMTGVFPFAKLNTDSEASARSAAITSMAVATDAVADRSEVLVAATTAQPSSGPLSNRAITLLDDESRAESPTDAIMPLRRVGATTLQASR